MSNTCETGNRCIRCRKLNYKKAVRQYQNAKKFMFEESLKDDMGNLRIHPDRIQKLLNMRAKLGKLQNSIENKKRKENRREQERKEKYNMILTLKMDTYTGENLDKDKRCPCYRYDENRCSVKRPDSCPLCDEA